MKHYCICFRLFPYQCFFQVQVRLFVPQNYQCGLSNLWAEFFGTVHDSLRRIAEFGLSNDILGRCFLVRIMEMKGDCDASSNWVVHKVLQLLEVCKCCGTPDHTVFFYNLCSVYSSFSASCLIIVFDIYLKLSDFLNYINLWKVDVMSNRILHFDYSHN